MSQETEQAEIDEGVRIVSAVLGRVDSKRSASRAMDRLIDLASRASAQAKVGGDEELADDITAALHLAISAQRHPELKNEAIDALLLTLRRATQPHIHTFSLQKLDGTTDEFEVDFKGCKTDEEIDAAFLREAEKRIGKRPASINWGPSGRPRVVRPLVGWIEKSLEALTAPKFVRSYEPRERFSTS